MPVRSTDPDELEGSTLHCFKVKPPGGGWAEVCLLDESDDPGSSDQWYIRIIRGAGAEPRRAITRRDVAEMRRKQQPRDTRYLIHLLKGSGLYTEELATSLCEHAYDRRNDSGYDPNPLDSLLARTIVDCPGTWTMILSRSGDDTFGPYSSDIYARRDYDGGDSWTLIHVHSDGTIQADSFRHTGDMKTIGDAVRWSYDFQ